MIHPAGTKLPERSIARGHCGTSLPGWLNGTHPTNLGTIHVLREHYGRVGKVSIF